MNNDDFIKIDYEMMVGDDRKVVATNLEKVAKENDIYDENTTYRDAVLVVGSENLFKEINESFIKAEIGKEVEVTITPENAFGVRDPKNIRVHTVREFQRLNIDPVVGQEVTINRKKGRVISVTPGRVLVDYNHQWAGKSVFYKYTVKEVIEDKVEKAKALIDMNYNIDSSKFELSLQDGNVNIVVPEEAKFDPMWIEAKYRVVNDIRKYLPDLDVSIVEKYAKQEKPEEVKEEAEAEKEEEKKEEKPAEEKVEKAPPKPKKEAKPKEPKEKKGEEPKKE